MAKSRRSLQFQRLVGLGVELGMGGMDGARKLLVSNGTVPNLTGGGGVVGTLVDKYNTVSYRGSRGDNRL